MTISICVVLCLLALLYSSTAAQNLAEVCVSFDASRDSFLNVKWNFTNSTIITINGMSQVYNGTNATDIPFTIGRTQNVNVTVCDQNNALSCQEITTVARYLYDVSWKRINNNSALEFTCEVACRTSSISGCSVVLSNPGGDGMSNVDTGSNEDIRPQFVTVVIDNVNPIIPYIYSAGALVIVNRTIITTTLTRGVIPALIQSDITNTTITPFSSSVVNTVPTETMTLSSTTDIAPIATNSMSVPPTETVITEPSGDDDNDDSGYLPVIIAASCACVLLLLIAIVLIIIIIRVKRRGKDSSNLSSPSVSKINNYDDLGDVKYFPISESQTNFQKTQSSSETHNQEDLHRNKTPEYDLPVFTSVEKTPVVASYNLLSVSDTTYDTPDDALNLKSESSSPPTEALYDPVSMEEHILKSDNGPKSPVQEYDKLVHSPTSQSAANLPPSIYDTLDEESLRNHYEFPDKDDDNGGFQSTAPLRISAANEDEYTVPQTS